ncbi:MAG TPA: excinuclease ABC subunit B, partial [Firmicutes bacterium]|nr:excinuclease ABC subunit B [Bacillota bacterium]
EHNERMGITPASIEKAIRDIAQEIPEEQVAEEKPDYAARLGGSLKEVIALIHELEEEMYAAAQDLNFERAAELRDEIQDIRTEMGLSV